MQALIFHHVSQPLRCSHEWFTVIGIDFLWTALSGCWNEKLSHNTVNFLYSGHFRDLELVSSFARVHFSQTSVIYFCRGFSCCPYYRGVRYSGVSVRRELTVVWTRIWYGTLHLRDRRRAASLCYQNGADQPPFLGVHQVWFSCWSKSYAM